MPAAAALGSERQERVVARMREGYRLAVRRYALAGDGPTYHACLVYSTDLTRRPPYDRIPWRTVEQLLRRQVIEKMRTIGDEDYYRLADEWRDHDPTTEEDA